MEKYTFKLTEEEIRMIRIALELETERREENHRPKAEDYKKLTEYFSRRIADIKR